MSRRLKIEKGTKFGMLTYLKDAPSVKLPSGQINRLAMCVCDCGKEKDVRLLHLVRKRITSCGCRARTRNGLGHTPLAKVWRQMKSRCLPAYRDRHLYFDKGISVCDEWIQSFEAFLFWSNSNGYVEGAKLQIDRVDNSRGYSPDNCRWVSSRINCNNRDVTHYVHYDGETHPIQLLLDRLGKIQHYGAIISRIHRGWSDQKAIDTPIRQGNYSRGKIHGIKCRQGMYKATEVNQQ